MVYVAKPVHQLDGSAFQGQNCVAASDAMLLERSTLGTVSVSGGHVRSLTGDTSGGLTLDEVRYVDRLAYGLLLDQENRYPWVDLPHAAANKGFILLGRYTALRGTKYDCFKGNFSGNHALWVNHRNADGSWHACDPGADGRAAGVPNGYMDYPDSVLRLFAGLLLISATSAATLGMGWAQVLFSRPDAPVVTGGVNQPVLTAPPTSERNVMIASAYGVAATRRQSLAKGQPVFRYPGGPKVTVMSAAVAVPYLGSAGGGWGAVLVGTGAPYKDKVTRPTIVYCPLAAGPIA